MQMVLSHSLLQKYKNIHQNKITKDRVLFSNEYSRSHHVREMLSFKFKVFAS